MTNLTITVEERVLQRARLRALTQGTSINAILRGFLEAYSAAQDDRAMAVQALLALSDEAASGRGDAVWTRDELHER